MTPKRITECTRIRLPGGAYLIVHDVDGARLRVDYVDRDRGIVAPIVFNVEAANELYGALAAFRGTRR